MARFLKRMFLLVCSICIVMVCSSSQITAKKKYLYGKIQYNNIANFYKEKKNTLNVLFIGDSNFNRAINPQIIWKDKKLTSFILTSASQPPWLSYYLLKDALRYQKPKAVFLDANLFFAAPSGRDERYCRVINAMSPDKNRLAAINNPTANFSKSIKKALLESYVKDYYLNLIKKEFKLKNEDKPSATKGFNMNVKQVPYQGNHDYMTTNPAFYSMVGEDVEYINKIVALCYEQHIHLSIIRTPSAQEWSNSRHHLVAQYAEANGLSFLDMNIYPYTDLINWQTDTKDGGLHLNVAGANKTTHAISEYLTQYYSFPVEENQTTIRNFDKSSELLDKKVQEMEESHTENDVVF